MGRIQMKRLWISFHSLLLLSMHLNMKNATFVTSNAEILKCLFDRAIHISFLMSSNLILVTCKNYFIGLKSVLAEIFGNFST